MKFLHLLWILLLLFSNCDRPTLKKESNTLFELKDNAAIGIDFSNILIDSPDFNVYKYRNFYNGGGVGIGDFNNDGLMDIFMISNQNSNKLFINKGDWQFEDITASAGVGGSRGWSTGVTIVDINGDGLLDIYVCNSGDIKGDNKENELFINMGNLRFEEKAVEYGLNDPGFTTHTVFFDYDKDGDLDAYILNNSFQAIGSFNLRKNERPIRDALGGDKLMENQNGRFIDVSEKAGIYSSVIGFGLGITIGDVNNDGWEDIYISNDFFERDYLYINQQNGTFKEDLTSQIPSTSAASMGADIADINNDGYSDIFVTDMLPSEYHRLKTVTTFDDWDRYIYGVNNGYHHQFTRNTLQKNNGNNTFSEVGRFSGVDASDWSWGALFFDMDNDGFKDLFIANGIYRDLTDQDYLQYISSESVMKSIISEDGVDYKGLIDIIPSRPIPNHAYKNNGDFQFSHYTSSGLLTPSFSNGSAYVDIDNDGDLDLIVNNVNMPCFIYENKADKVVKNNYIKIDLKGTELNSMAIGTKVKVTGKNNAVYYYEHQPMRGFQSSMDPRINIGVGASTEVDIEIYWHTGKISTLSKLKTNQQISVFEKDANEKVDKLQQTEPSSAWALIDVFINYSHKENSYIDFNRERLNYHMMSTLGPKTASGDINNDGFIDFVIPGAKGSPTVLMMGQKDGTWVADNKNTIFDALKDHEHVRAVLLDLNGDNALDLYLASGGVENSEYSDNFEDLILLNNGKGIFTLNPSALPFDNPRISTSAVTFADIDKDGDLDIFVGQRVVVGNYCAPVSGYIFLNDGNGKFKDQTSTWAPILKNIGMITDAYFEDLDGDQKVDLIIVGEFMDVVILRNTGKDFSPIKNNLALNGWWNVIHVMDIDQDGDKDIILGNHGLNSRFKATANEPIWMYHGDFDQNGQQECILAKQYADKSIYPYALRHNLMTQIPSLNKKYPKFDDFKNATVEDIFSKEVLSKVYTKNCTELRSLILVNNGNFTFSIKTLPLSVQYSPIFAINSMDINKDGVEDLIMGGNLYGVKPEMGRYDASYGHYLINDGKGNFSTSKEYHFPISGEIRDFYAEKDILIAFLNNTRPIVLKLKK